MEKKYAIAEPLAIEWCFLAVDVIQDKKFDEKLFLDYLRNPLTLFANMHMRTLFPEKEWNC